jgi:hypothetical protein
MFRFDKWFQVLSDAVDEGGGGGGAVSGVESAIQTAIGEGGAEGDPAAGAADPDPEEAELSQLEKEWQAQNPNAKGSLAIHRHQAVLTRNRNQWAAKEKEYQDQLKAVEWAKDPELKAALQVLQLAETNQKGFAEALLKDPRFAELLTFKEQQQQAQEDPEANRPGPNQTSPDGKYQYYDQDGLKALLEWERQRAVQLAKSEFMKEFGPVKQEYEQRNAWNGALESQRKVLDGARKNWKGFTEAEGKIKQALIEHPEMDLHDAYRTVVIEGLSVQRDTLRKEILAELNGKPAATNALKPTGGVQRTDEKTERSIEDVILASLPRDR